jgi:hypothetical protein
VLTDPIYVASECANLSQAYRADGKAQVLDDQGDQYTISFPSQNESLILIEIVHVGDVVSDAVLSYRRKLKPS